MNRALAVGKVVIINLIVLIVLFELIALLYVRSQPSVGARWDRIPTYLDIISNEHVSFSDVLNGLDTLSVKKAPIAPHAIDTLYPWCTWHPKNNKYRQQLDCIDEVQAYNSMGARGPLPKADDSNSIFFIGDSFVEGFGLHDDSTISERVGRVLDRPRVNLGTSGNFGSTQMSLVYKHFAKRLPHSEAVVFLYLGNDFVDNNADLHRSGRYRPYRVVSGDSSEIIYKGDVGSTTYSWDAFNQLKARGFRRHYLSQDESTLNKLSRITYSRCLVSYLLFRMSSSTPPELNYSAQDLEILAHDIRDMIETAKSKGATITFTNLPSQVLLRKTVDPNGDGKEFDKAYSKLENEINKMVEASGGNFVSFYEHVKKNSFDREKMFFTCDAHFSNYGESLLAEFCLAKVFDAQY